MRRLKATLEIIIGAPTVRSQDKPRIIVGNCMANPLLMSRMGLRGEQKIQQHAHQVSSIKFIPQNSTQQSSRENTPGYFSQA